MLKQILGALVVGAVAALLLWAGYVQHRDSMEDAGEVRGDLAARVTARPEISPRVPADHAAGDSLPINPPNGLAYAGSGRFQVYRQGDLTWRFDTENGQSCILFATMEQWANVLVYRNGCGAD